jgi:LytS/YehU family sensor histidine kinase
MLRHAVETARVQEVPLREELSTLRLYTQIQQVRFGERLRLTWTIEEQTFDAAVPHMLLQPLVENAIKHGVEAHSNAGAITISAARAGNTLALSIRDDGPGFSKPSPRRGPGMGIANVRNRLTQLYGESHSFRVADAAGGGTMVEIRIRFVVIEQADKHADAIQHDRNQRPGAPEDAQSRPVNRPMAVVVEKLPQTRA